MKDDDFLWSNLSSIAKNNINIIFITSYNQNKIKLQFCMQANCLLFPSPSNYNIQPIKKHIILIPRAEHNNQHTTYTSLLQNSNKFQRDQFSQYVEEVQKSCNHKQKWKERSDIIKCQYNNDNEDKIATGQNSLQVNFNLDQKVYSQQYIPCLFLKNKKNKIIIFYHANGEDICSAYQFINLISKETEYPILAMEYRGYSFYQGQTNSTNIEEDAVRVIKFLHYLKFTSEQIILLGRSIGSAVALNINNHFSVFCTILLSPFLSIKKVAKELYCSCAGKLVKQVFNNEQNCKGIQCPLLIIHGQKDTLIPYDHSLELMSKCLSYCRLKLIRNMTHSKFNFRQDFIKHLRAFLKDIS